MSFILSVKCVNGIIKRGENIYYLKNESYELEVIIYGIDCASL